MLFFSFFLVFISCDENRVFEENTDIKMFDWTYDNIIKFETELNDSLPKNVLINFRHSHSFESRNVLLKMHITTPNGEKSTSRINIPLSEPNGRWYGDCSGDICDIQYQIPAFKNYTFKEKGKYTFELEQDMRENPLAYTMSVGLRIENAVEK